jgi:hypothetical protein
LAHAQAETRIIPREAAEAIASTARFELLDRKRNANPVRRRSGVPSRLVALRARWQERDFSIPDLVHVSDPLITAVEHVFAANAGALGYIDRNDSSVHFRVSRPRRHDDCTYGPPAMTIAHAYTLMLEAVVLGASFAMLWLVFWVRDRRRQLQQTRQPRPTHLPVTDFANPQQDLAMVGRPLAPVGVASGVMLAIDLASRDVQPPGEKDEAVLPP